MGNQINFYMLAEDEREFVRFLRADRDVGIFIYAFPTKDIPLLTELPATGVPFGSALWLWDRNNSPKPQIAYVQQQDYYVVDEPASEVIQFSRSYFDTNRLVRGRIWAEMVGWHRGRPEETFLKSESFRKWYKRLANWIKRRSIQNEVGNYLMPHAAEYVRRGGTYCQMVFADGTAI